MRHGAHRPTVRKAGYGVPSDVSSHSTEGNLCVLFVIRHLRWLLSQPAAGRRAASGPKAAGQGRALTAPRPSASAPVRAQDALSVVVSAHSCLPTGGGQEATGKPAQRIVLQGFGFCGLFLQGKETGCY